MKIEYKNPPVTAGDYKSQAVTILPFDKAAYGHGNATLAREKLMKYGLPLFFFSQPKIPRFIRDWTALQYALWAAEPHLERWEAEQKAAQKTTNPKGAGRKPMSAKVLFVTYLVQKLGKYSDVSMAEALTGDPTMLNQNDLAARACVLSLIDQGKDIKLPRRAVLQKYRGIFAHDGLLDQIKAAIIDMQLEHARAFIPDATDGDTLEVGSAAIIDATFFEKDIDHLSRSERAALKKGKAYEFVGLRSFASERQLNFTAAWAKKNNHSYYGFKGHFVVEALSKLVIDHTLTAANIADIMELEPLALRCGERFTSLNELYADSGYCSNEREDNLKKAGIEPKFITRTYRNANLTDEQKANNKERSRIRVRVEHVFAFLKKDIGFKIRCAHDDNIRAEVDFAVLAHNINRMQCIYSGRYRRPKRVSVAVA